MIALELTKEQAQAVYFSLYWDLEDFWEKNDTNDLDDRRIYGELFQVLRQLEKHVVTVMEIEQRIFDTFGIPTDWPHKED